MPTAVQVLTDWRYYHIAESANPDKPAKSKVAKLGDIVLVYLEDPEVNPRKNVLKFKDIEGVSDPLLQFKSIPNIVWDPDKVQQVDFKELVIAMDEAWFKFTIDNGFIFKKDNGTIIKAFTDLEVPNASDMPKMNPIVP